MNGMMLGAGFVICAAIWLVLLVATGFSLVVVSLGLLGVLFITGSSSGERRGQPVRGHLNRV